MLEGGSPVEIKSFSITRLKLEMEEVLEVLGKPYR